MIVLTTTERTDLECSKKHPYLTKTIDALRERRQSMGVVGSFGGYAGKLLRNLLASKEYLHNVHLVI